MSQYIKQEYKKTLLEAIKNSLVAYCAIIMLTCKEFKIVNSHVKTSVYWFTESNPNIHVHPRMGSKVTEDFIRDLTYG